MTKITGGHRREKTVLALLTERKITSQRGILEAQVSYEIISQAVVPVIVIAVAALYKCWQEGDDTH